MAQFLICSLFAHSVKHLFKASNLKIVLKCLDYFCHGLINKEHFLSVNISRQPGYWDYGKKLVAKADPDGTLLHHYRHYRKVQEKNGIVRYDVTVMSKHRKKKKVKKETKLKRRLKLEKGPIITLHSKQKKKHTTDGRRHRHSTPRNNKLGEKVAVTIIDLTEETDLYEEIGQNSKANTTNMNQCTKLKAYQQIQNDETSFQIEKGIEVVEYKSILEDTSKVRLINKPTESNLNNDSSFELKQSNVKQHIEISEAVQTLKVDNDKNKVICQRSQTTNVVSKVKQILKESRLWEESNYSYWFNKHGYQRKNGAHFSVMSYNVLAQNLLEDNKYLYSHCDPSYLEWNYRKANLFKEIKDQRPDIVCLQEVVFKQFGEFWMKSFAALGYDGLYKKRHGDKRDGCALFYRKSKLNLVHYTGVDYYKPGIPLMDRDNVGLVALFHPVGLPQSSTFCVATTHLLFNPKRGDIKLIQVVNLLAEIDRITGAHPSPVIICGDFNSTPHSYLYRLLTSGMLSYPGLSADVISGQRDYHSSRNILDLTLITADMNLTEACTYKERMAYTGVEKYKRNNEPSSDVDKVVSSLIDGAVATLSSPVIQPTGVPYHQLPLVSVYDHVVSRERGYGEVSTHHTRACCTLDYIFYSVAHKSTSLLPNGEISHSNITDGKLHVMRRYRLMSDREVLSCGGLPNAHQSSDHIPLIAHFFLEV